MSAQYVITELQGILAGFLLREGRLWEVHPFPAQDILGNVYAAEAVRVIPSVGAAFLDAGLEDTLYYHLDDSAGHLYIRHGKKDHLAAGDLILVQVSRDAMGKKKASATSDLTLTGKYALVNRRREIGISAKIKDPEKRKSLKEAASEVQELNEATAEYGAGLIIRTSAAALQNARPLQEEIVNLLSRQRDLIRRGKTSVKGSCLLKTSDVFSRAAESARAVKMLYPDLEIITDSREVHTLLPEVVFQEKKEIPLTRIYPVERDLTRITRRLVHLKSGGSVVVDVTEALTAIDVNSGKSVTGSDAGKKYLETNLEAAEMIARILRIRNISGMILIDFINMKRDSEKRALIQYIKNIISGDPVPTKYVDITGLGLVELTRKKEEKPLAEVLKF